MHVGSQYARKNSPTKDAVTVTDIEFCSYTTKVTFEVEWDGSQGQLPIHEFLEYFAPHGVTEDA